MTIAQFIAKWKKAELKQRAAAQAHFLHLCDPVQVDAPDCAAYGVGGSRVGKEESVRELLSENALRSIPVSPAAAE